MSSVSELHRCVEAKKKARNQVTNIPYMRHAGARWVFVSLVENARASREEFRNCIASADLSSGDKAFLDKLLYSLKNSHHIMHH